MKDWTRIQTKMNIKKSDVYEIKSIINVTLAFLVLIYLEATISLLATHTHYVFSFIIH